MKEIKKRIKEAREKKQLNQEELGKMINKSQSAIAAIEAGRNTASYNTLKELCQALEISADYILGIEKKEKANYNVSEEGEKLIEDYIKYIQEKYPQEKKYTKAGNL